MGSTLDYIDANLTNGTTYHYKIYSYDGSYNYSSGVTVFGVPSKVHRTCLEYLDNGSVANGDYLIDPDGVAGLPAFTVTCDQTGGGWTKIPVGGSATGFATNPQTCTTDGSDYHGLVKYSLTNAQIDAIKVLSTTSKQTVVYDYTDDDTGRIDLKGWDGTVALTRWRNSTSSTCSTVTGDITTLSKAPIKEVYTVDCNGDTRERCSWDIQDAWFK